MAAKECRHGPQDELARQRRMAQLRTPWIRFSPKANINKANIKKRGYRRDRRAVHDQNDDATKRSG